MNLELAEIEAARLESLAEETERIAIEAGGAAVREATLLEVSATDTAASETYISNLARSHAEYALEIAMVARTTADEAAAAVEAATASEPPVEIEGSTSGPDCSSCVYEISRGVHFFADPLNCHRYYVCERQGEIGGWYYV